VAAHSLADDEIDCRNLRESGSKPRPAAAAAAQADMMEMVVVVVVKVVERLEFGDLREQSSSDGICL
jgi:hypothetical protein